MFAVDTMTMMNWSNKFGVMTSYPVKANTLVIADIRGFHCRGQALENQARISIYANIRPAPFLPAINIGFFKRLFKKYI